MQVELPQSLPNLSIPVLALSCPTEAAVIQEAPVLTLRQVTGSPRLTSKVRVHSKVSSQHLDSSKQELASLGPTSAWIQVKLFTWGSEFSPPPPPSPSPDSKVESLKGQTSCFESAVVSCPLSSDWLRCRDLGVQSLWVPLVLVQESVKGVRYWYSPGCLTGASGADYNKGPWALGSASGI